MKIILRFCLISVVVFLISFIFSFIFFASAFKVVKELKWISGIAYEWIVLILSFMTAVFFTTLLIVHIIRKRSSRIENWLSLNYPQMILWYAISTIAFVSLKSKIIWSVEDLREIISLQWMVFGIAITIFLVWNVLIIKHLKEKIASKEEVTSLLEKKKLFETKFDLFQQASNRFNIAKLLVINLIILLITTAAVYISNNGVQINLFNQNLSIASFYFCTNTISAMFLDVLSSFNEEKNNLLKNLKPTPEEIASQREVEAELASAYNELKLIEKLNLIDDKEKTKLIRQVFNRIVKKSSVSENPESHNN